MSTPAPDLQMSVEEYLEAEERMKLKVAAMNSFYYQNIVVSCEPRDLERLHSMANAGG